MIILFALILYVVLATVASAALRARLAPATAAPRRGGMFARR